MAIIRTMAAIALAWLAMTATAFAQAPTLPAPPPPPPTEIVTSTEYVVAAPLRPTWQFQIDPFLMWYSRARFPALVSTGDPLNDAMPGALGEPGTRVLSNGSSLSGHGVPGLRLTVASTFGDEDRGSIDIGGFMVATQTGSTNFSSDSQGNPLLVRPFYYPVAQQEWADYRSYPGYLQGTASDTLTTRIYGAEANVRWDFLPITPVDRFGFGMLVGARYFQLNEDYSNNDTAIDLPALGTTYAFGYSDKFSTRNAFAGAQVGMVGKWRWDKVGLDVTGKVLGGNLSQSIDISGTTRLSDGNGTTAVDYRQGLYAMASNIGHYTRDSFTMGGELGLKLGIRVNDYFRFNVGYSIFAIGNIVRPGDQIDRTINVQTPFTGGGVGVARPQPTFRETTFSTQMLNLGFEFVY